MAYQFVNADQLNAGLTSVANAIRSKSKTEAKLLFPGGMVNAISAISTGAEMNFQVVGSMDQPGDPEENMIWICTEVVCDWYFQPEQPENMLTGDVWIRTGTASNVAFNALKKNSIMVYPISAKLVNFDGILEDVVAKTWQNGKWVDWWNGELLDGANLFETATGGWVQDENMNISGYPNTGTVTFDGNGITLSNAPGATCAVVRTRNKINLSQYSKLTVNAKSITASGNISVRIYIITDASGDVDIIKVASIENIPSADFADYELPFNLDGEYYIALVISAGRSGTVKKIHLS